MIIICGDDNFTSCMSISNTLLLTKGLVSSATIPSRTWMMYNFQWLKITIRVISMIENFLCKHRRYLAFLCIVSQKVEKNLVENRKSGWTCWINKSWTLDKSCLVSRLILSTISSHQPLHIVWKQTFKTHVIPYILSSVAVIVHYIFLLHITVPHIITILSSYQCSVLVKDHSFGPELKTGVGAFFVVEKIESFFIRYLPKQFGKQLTQSIGSDFLI